MEAWAGGRVVEAITRAALDPDAWQGVTDALSAELPGTMAAVVGHDATLLRNIRAAHTGYDESYGDSYEAHYSRTIPNLPRWAALPLGHVAQVWEIMTEAELLRSEYYNDWLRPQADARDAAIAVLQRDPGRMFLFTAQVDHRAAPRVMEPLLRLARAAYPLMRHALEVNRVMLGLRLDSVLLRHGLEPEGAATLLLGEGGGVIHADALAERMLEDGDVLRGDGRGRLRMPDPSAEARLEAALLSRPGAGLRFPLPGPAGTWDVTTLRVSPEAVGRLDLPTLTRMPVPRLLVVLRPARTAADEEDQVARRLGLSPREAAVALALADGASVAEVAESRGASPHTVRNQVKSALAKTGARRQGELARIVRAARLAR